MFKKPFKNYEETLRSYHESDIDPSGNYIWNHQMIRYIDWAAFRNCEALVSMDIPEGVEYIEDEAFRNCSNLRHIKIPDSVSYIGKKAFSGCTGIIYELDGAEYVDNWLVGVHPLTETLKIKPGTVGIAYDAFHNCERIRNVIIPNCEFLKEIIIPKELRYICEIGDIDHKVDIHVDSLEDWCQIFFNDDMGRNLMYRCNHLIIGNNQLIGDLFLPDGIEQINTHAFWGQKDIKKIHFSSKIKEIGGEAFSCCTGLHDIVIPDSVKTIGYEAFMHCENLESVIFPSRLEAIRQEAFRNCFNLRTNILPDTLTFIGSGAFMNTKCYGTITIPDGVKEICSETFFRCSEITEIILPKELKCIGAHAFEGCTGLTQITIPDHVETIKDAAFSGCSSLKNVIIGKGVKSIPKEAFAGCESLEKVIIPESVETIQERAFKGCSMLTQIVICSPKTYVPEELFENDNSEIAYISGETLISKDKALSNVFNAVYEGKTLDVAIATEAKNFQEDVKDNAILGVYFKNKLHFAPKGDRSSLSLFHCVKPIHKFGLVVYSNPCYHNAFIIGFTTSPHIFDYFKASFLILSCGTIQAIKYRCSIAGWHDPIVYSGEAILDSSLKQILEDAGMKKEEIDRYTFRNIYSDGISRSVF